MTPIPVLLLQVFLSSLLGILLSFGAIKAILYIFKLNIIEEIKKNNPAAAILAAGIFIGIGLLIGLAK